MRSVHVFEGQSLLEGLQLLVGEAGGKALANLGARVIVWESSLNSDPIVSASARRATIGMYGYVESVKDAMGIASDDDPAVFLQCAAYGKGKGRGAYTGVGMSDLRKLRCILDR